MLRSLGLNFAARGGVWSGRGFPGGGSGAGHRDGRWSVEVRAGPPPSAPGVHVTRQRGAATGRAHPAAAAPGPSRVEVRRDRRRADPERGQVRPPGRRGRGLRRAGPGGCRGRVCVSGGGRGSGSEGERLWLFGRSRLLSRDQGWLCTGPGSARGAQGVRDCACTRVFVWRGPGCVSAYALGRHCAWPGCGARACPAQPLLRGCFPNRLPAEMGSAAAVAGGGSAAPTGLQRPRQPGDCRQTPEGGRGRAPGMGPEAWPEGEAKMDRLRQMDREVEVDKQAEMGKKVGREMVKRTEAGRTESH